MRARDFIFEAVSRRGFLKGLGAAAAAQAAGVKIPTSAPTPTPTPTPIPDIRSLFHAAKDYILNNPNYFSADDDDPIEPEDSNVDATDSDKESEEPQSLTGYMPNQAGYEILKTPKGRPWLYTGSQYGNSGIITYFKDNKPHVIEYTWDYTAHGPGEVHYTDQPDGEDIFYQADEKIGGFRDDNEQWGKLVDSLIDGNTDNFNNIKKQRKLQSKVQTSQISKEISNLSQKILTNHLGNKFKDKILTSDVVKEILNHLSLASKMISPTSDNVLDVEPTDVTVHEPMQALPAPQQALPHSLENTEANFVQALGRDLTDQERVLIQQEYDKQVK